MGVNLHSTVDAFSTLDPTPQQLRLSGKLFGFFFESWRLTNKRNGNSSKKNTGA